MRKSFKIQAGLSLLLGVFSLLTSALTLLPGQPLFSSEPLLAMQVLALFPLSFITIVRGCALEVAGVRLKGELQRQAFRGLPAAVRYGLIGCFLTGVTLVASSVLAGTELQAGGREGGQYYAIQVDSRNRGHIAVSQEEYYDLLKKDRRAMHAIVGMLATGGAAMTLIIGQLHPSTGRYLPPPRLDGPLR